MARINNLIFNIVWIHNHNVRIKKCKWILMILYWKNEFNYTSIFCRFIPISNYVSKSVIPLIFLPLPRPFRRRACGNRSSKWRLKRRRPPPPPRQLKIYSRHSIGTSSALNFTSPLGYPIKVCRFS